MTVYKNGLSRAAQYVVLAGVGFGLMGCELQQTGSASQTQPAGLEFVEKDVESPEVFEANETALWDGRPSLGGIWIAAPEVTDPERVIIRNPKNDKFVIGALFRRAREYAGPRLQLSSDAADALGILAGQPTMVSVVALRRETVSVTPDPVIETADAVPQPDTIEEEALAAAAVAVATQIPAATASTPATQSRPKARPEGSAAKPKPAASSKVSKPFVQLGIFGVEDNAKNTAQSMRQRGIIPTIKKLEMNGKPFWRVIVGPATSQDELKTILDKVKKAGFADAYAVSG